MAILCTVMEEWIGKICHHQVWYRSCYQALSSVAKHPQKGHHMGASNSHATAYKGKGTWNTLKAYTRLRFENYATVPSLVHPLHSSPSVRPTSPHGPDVTSYTITIIVEAVNFVTTLEPRDPRWGLELATLRYRVRRLTTEPRKIACAST